MRFPVPLRPQDKRSLVDTLWKNIPTRRELRFQISDGRTAAKAVLGEDYTVEERERVQKLIFCVAHGDFVLEAGMDLDHVAPFARIREKQQNYWIILRIIKNLPIFF